MKDCTCYCQVDKTVRFYDGIKHCPKHAAADDLLAMLKKTVKHMRCSCGMPPDAEPHHDTLIARAEALITVAKKKDEPEKSPDSS